MAVEMVERKQLRCKNCGGTIDKVTMKCLYCDTQYEKEHGLEPTPIVVDRRGVERLCASIAVDEECIAMYPNVIDQFAKSKVMGLLAKELLKYATITVQGDPRSFRKIINATIEVVPPKKEI